MYVSKLRWAQRPSYGGGPAIFFLQIHLPLMCVVGQNLIRPSDTQCEIGRVVTRGRCWLYRLHPGCDGQDQTDHDQNGENQNQKWRVHYGYADVARNLLVRRVKSSENGQPEQVLSKKGRYVRILNRRLYLVLDLWKGSIIQDCKIYCKKTILHMDPESWPRAF